ncbi:MAG: rod shape-determining protein MreC [Leptothrix sp. (in: Bacteria)]|jgi:rod shape-determining protein MreC|nr:rod shape-determining protein MreC [Leptothrix sp. (in: b-proteobacteria)]
MSLNTLDRTPPPFFRQGPSALTRVLLFASLSVFLMAMDSRVGVTQPLRSAIAVLLRPLQQVMLTPVHTLSASRDYLTGIAAVRQSAEAARAQLARLSERSLQLEVQQQENQRLRQLLDLRPRVNVPTHAAEILYTSSDPYTRRVVIDRGSLQGIRAGSPVINEVGVLGQVTRVYPGSSEVTLLTDRDSALPVLLERSAQRSIAMGSPRGGGLELRYVAGNADVQVGDRVLTSGLDGVYPSGYPVGRVAAVERRTQSDFAQIEVHPVATPDGVRHVLVLDPMAAQLPASAASEASAPGRAASAPIRKGGRSK